MFLEILARLQDLLPLDVIQLHAIHCRHFAANLRTPGVHVGEVTITIAFG